MIKILVLDNYDSFTYNLVHALKNITNSQIEVYRNDEISLAEVDKYDKIVLSPGPGIPDEAGILKPLIKEYGASKSILGVCLGLQAIAEVYGGELYNLSTVFHGVATEIKVVDEEEKLFNSLPETFKAGRYHSWAVKHENLPNCLKITSLAVGGEIMALRHTTHDVRGVQFHPESVLTEHGIEIIKNWLVI